MTLNRIFFITFVAISLAACSQPTPAITPSAVVTGPNSACPAATAHTETFTNDAHGYCVLIPTGYAVLRPNPDEVILQRSSALDPNENVARVYIFVSPAEGRNVAGFADQLAAGAEQFGVTRTSAQVGGEEALILDHLPGQDVNRQVLVVHGQNFYHLTFVPLDGSQPETLAEAEALYKLVTSTFSFGPQGS